MLDLAIEIDTDSRNTSIVDTNHGVQLKCPDWPHDCDFQLVGFNPSEDSCEVVWADGLSEDIAEALFALDQAAVFEGRKPDWYLRLELYARGASSA
jgi:hypothetical protein